jgi:hypothetical protein
MCGIEKGSSMVQLDEKLTIELVVMHVFVDRDHSLHLSYSFHEIK